MTLRILFASALFFALFTQAFPQSAQTQGNDIKYRLAQSYERSGDIESAVKLYAELYAKDSLNLIIFDALRRGYLQLKRYDDLLELVHRASKRAPNDITLLAELGAVYVHRSEDQLAYSAWDRAIAVDPKHETTYRIVSNVVIENRLFDKAIELYKRGRTALGDPTMFSSDIAYLEAIMLKYTDATQEYLNVIRQNAGQLMYVQSRIAGYTGRPDGLAAATSTVETAVHAEPDNLPFAELLAWLYMEAKHYDRAFETYKVIDAKKKGGGLEIYGFAQRALKDKAFDISRLTFLEVMTRYPGFNPLSDVLFGYARSLEELAAAGDTLSTTPDAQKMLYDDALKAYRKVISVAPGSELAAKSLIRVAALQQDRFFDLEAARTTLQTIVGGYGAFGDAFTEAIVRLGDLYVSRGDLSSAEKQYLSVTQGQVLIGDQREKAALRLAQLDYFRGNFKDASAKLQKLSRNANSDIANDALKLQIFIDENLPSGEPALREYARGELLQLQRKPDEALSTFSGLATKDTASSLVDECLMNEGDICLSLRRYQDAVGAYRQLVAKFPESIVLDLALMKIGTTYEKSLHDTANAIVAYKQILEKYPNSIYSTDARKRIRELRGDTM
jgi:tetratricopeptide (TPR) repeat protein